MVDPLSLALSTFIKTYICQESPILLGLSGGPDSLALFYLLIEYRQSNPSFAFSIAHIDHGWRIESSQEAKTLESLASKFLVPFHLKTLTYVNQGNLESLCREARLLFFADLCFKHRYEGVMLAHHADDVAETVLKRLFEGVTLPYLCGLRPEICINKVGCTQINKYKLWRPLLTIFKKDIEAWLAKRQLKGFHDVTNFDPKFMRARLRVSILPSLKDMFGKSIESSLCRISKESKDLREYLDEKSTYYIEKMINGPLGSCLDLSQERPHYKLEIKHLIRRFCEMNELSLSFCGLEMATDMLITSQRAKQVSFGKQYLYVDHHRLFVAHHQLELALLDRSLISHFTIKDGHIDPQSFLFDSIWHFSIHNNEIAKDNLNHSNWKKLIENKAQLQLMPGDYEIMYPQSQHRLLNGQLLSSWFRLYKVPVFLRMCVPVICRNGVVYQEFLSGIKPQFFEEKELETSVIYLSALNK